MKKTTILKIKLFLCIAILFFSISCVSTGSNIKVENDFQIIQTEERMFWEIHGTSEAGTPSIIYILGTIHAGDDRLYPLSDYVYEAFVDSSTVVAELSSHDLSTAPFKVGVRMMGGMDFSRNLYDIFDERQMQYLHDNFTQEELDELKMLEPWTLTTVLSDKIMREAGLHSDSGIDMYLYSHASVIEKDVLGLDTLDEQVNIITYRNFTYDEQAFLIKKAIDDSIEVNQVDLLEALYHSYLENDAEAIGVLTHSSIGESELEQAYFKSLSSDRNKKWADKIIEYLNAGGSTFIYAGVAHFCGEDTVFDFLKQYQE